MLNTTRSEFKEESIEIYSYAKTFDTIDSAHLLSLLSWNIIHKDFVDPNDYTYASPNDLDWNKRLPKIKNKISSSNADIVCLQEIDKHTFGHDIGDYFVKQHGYTFKVNNQKKSKVDFSQAIMYKSSKFECEYEDYRARAMILLLTNKIEKSKCNKCNNYKKSKNICIHHSFFLVTVHLDSPRKNKDNESTRVNQIKSVLKRINFCIKETLKLDICSEIENIRILIVGDFNSGYEDAASQMLLCNNHETFKHKYTFCDAYHEELISGNHNYHKLAPNNCNLRIKYFPTYAAIQNIFAIDLMFYTHNNFKVKGITNTLPEMVKNKVNWDKIMGERINKWIENDKKTNLNGQYHLANYNDILLLPNQDFPSDHLPLGAIFEFDNICDRNNERNKICRCCVEQIIHKKIHKKKNKNKRRKNKKNNNNNNKNTEWKFHSINSF